MLNEAITDNTKTIRGVKRTLIFSKTQIMILLSHGNTDKNKIIWLVTKYLSDLFKTPKTFKEKMFYSCESIPQIITEIANDKLFGNDSATVEICRNEIKETLHKIYTRWVVWWYER